MRTLPTIKLPWPRVGRWAAVACVVLFSAGWASPAYAVCGGGPSFPCDWGYKRKLTFNNSGQLENLVDFPVLVVLDGSRIDYSQTQNAGQDLRFTDSDGTTLLAHEIEKWDEAGTSYVWVKVAQIDASSTTDHIWMFYGNPTAPDGQNPTAVWSNGYVGVWHMKEDPSGTAPQMKDSTSSADHGTANGSMTSANQVPGKIAGSLDLDGGNDYIQASDYDIVNAITISAWIYWDAVTTNDGIVSKRTPDENNGNWALRMDSSTPGLLQWMVWTGIDSSQSFRSTSTISAGAWTHVILTYDDPTNTVKYYINGVLDKTSTSFTNSLADTPEPIRIGQEGQNDYFDGRLDEVRLSNVARSADWIKAQYLSMTDAFISFGSQEAVDCGGGGPPPTFTPCNWQSRRKLTFNNSAQAENLTNFPVLVVLDGSRIDYSQTQNAGQDLRFTDSDGTTLLAHEIEKWDEAGTSYVWVKVPQIDASSTTDHIYMYYGNASAADGQNPGDVWSNGYAGVWHLGEASNSTRSDSTCNANNVSDVNTVAATTGKIGDAANFVAASTEYLTISDAAQTGLDVSTQFTLEAWAKATTGGNTETFFGKQGNGTTWPYAYSLRWSGSNIFTIVYSFDGTTAINVNGVTTLSTGTWYYAVGTFDGSQFKLYLNGVLDKSAAAAGTIFNSTVAFDIGARYTGNQPFNGSVDEGRVSSVARSAAWIAAQYKSMTDTFITFGAQEGSGAAPEVTFFAPDAFAPGMHVPVTFVGNFCSGSPAVTTSSSDIVVGPSILTDATGAVVASNGTVLTTMFFVKPSARPATGVTVSVNGASVSQTLDLVIPAPDPNITSGTGTLSGRTKRGTKVLGGLTVGSGATLTINTADTDAAAAGNQGYLPAVVLVKGDVSIAGTLDVKGQQGSNAAASCAGGDGGAGGPGGGGGGGGGMTQTGCGSGSVAIDAISTNTGTGASLTVSHTTSGTDRLMLVVPQWNAGSNIPKFVTGVTYNGVPLTLVQHAQQVDDGATDIWMLVNPPTGTHNVVITYDVAPNFAHIAGVMTFTGVDQTTPLGTPAWNNESTAGTSATASVVVSSASGELVFATVAAETPDTVTWQGGTPEHWHIAAGGNNTVGAGATNPGAATVTMTWTNVNDHWAAAGVSIKPAPASGGTAAAAGAGFSGGGGGGSKGTGTGAAGGTGSGAVGSGASGATGGDGGTALGGATSGGGGGADTGVAGGGGGGGGTGNPFGTGGAGAFTDNAAGGQGGGGGGAPGTTAGGGGGGGFATAGTRGPNTPDAGFGGNVNGNAQFVPLTGGSGGGGGGPDVDVAGRGGGGGGGGGAVLIYATGSVAVSGTITAQGGNGGTGYTSGSHGSGGGGGGSGGAVFLQSGNATASGTLTTAGGTAGTSTGNAAGGAGGTGRIRIDGLASGTTISTIAGTAGSRFIGPVIDTLVDTTVKGRADGGATVTLYVYDQNGAQVTGSPYSTSASGSSGTVGTWTINNVTFPSSGTGYLAVKQSSGSYAVFGPGRATKGVHLINWREVY